MLGGCVQCGRKPAATVDLRAHTGMVVLARYSRIKGDFCKQCGLALFRDRMNHTLAFGWWGVLAFFLNFYAIAKNLASWFRLRQLDEPEGVRQPDADEPLDAGRPVFLRPGAAVVAALFILGGVVFNDQGVAEQDVTGRCVNVGQSGMKLVDCDDDHDGMVLNVANHARGCAPGSDEALRMRREFLPIACVDLDR